MARLTLKTAAEVTKRNGRLSEIVILDVGLSQIPMSYWSTAEVKDAYFLGCEFGSERLESDLRSRGAVIVSKVRTTIYDPFRSGLYTSEELTEGYKPGQRSSLDERIFDQYGRDGHLRTDIIEALTRRLHDFAIDEACEELLDGIHEKGKRIVGVMGGSSKSRKDPFYVKVAKTAWELAQQNFFIVTGGGPGMMEAANLGAYMSKRTANDLDTALAKLGEHPDVRDEVGFIQAAIDVCSLFPKGEDSLGIPTWFYGNEPTNRFANYSAKYFANSIREDGIIAHCTGGIIFAPGSAGTAQEIFMNCAQNHYGTYDFYSPMVFFGVRRYAAETSIYNLVAQVANANYHDLVALCDEPEEVVNFLKKTPAVPKKK